MSSWFDWTLLLGGFLLFGLLVAIPVTSLIDEWFRKNARDRFFESINTTFDRGLLSGDRLKIFARDQQLEATDIRRVVVRLLREACLGRIKRKDEDDVKEIQVLLRELEEEDPFQALPSELKGPLQRIRAALSEQEIMDPLLGHLREFSVANRKERRRSYVIAIVGVVLSVLSIALAIWFK